MSDPHPETPRCAEHRGDYRQNVGSVGKLLAALGYFQALADAWPRDLDRRTEILRDTVMTADDFSQHDHHTIRLFDVETRELTRRSMQVGDQGSFFTRNGKKFVNGRWLHYVVIVISNVLRENPARAHQRLGGAVHRMIRANHGIGE